MSPAFAPSLRKLLDLATELRRLEAGNKLLDVIRKAPDADEADRSWVVNAALTSGVSGLYTGMEEVLRSLLAVVDGHVPTGERSHQDILDQASVPVEGVRLAIISTDVYDALVALKGFRHFERYSYRFRFIDALVDENESRAEQVVPRFIREVEVFIRAMSPPSDADV